MDGFDDDAVDSLIEHLVSAGAVKSPSGQALYPSEVGRSQYLKKRAAAKVREEAREKRKAIRRAIKETPKIERRYLYAGVLAKAISE